MRQCVCGGVGLVWFGFGEYRWGAALDVIRRRDKNDWAIFSPRTHTITAALQQKCARHPDTEPFHSIPSIRALQETLDVVSAEGKHRDKTIPQHGMGVNSETRHGVHGANLHAR